MPLDPEWKSVALYAPDSRAAVSRGEKKHRLLGNMEMCFCVNCGKEHGMVTKDWAKYVFALCDDCVSKHGPPPGVQQIPDAWVEGRK